LTSNSQETIFSEMRRICQSADQTDKYHGSGGNNCFHIIYVIINNEQFKFILCKLTNSHMVASQGDQPNKF
jgi:hypothetical protein